MINALNYNVIPSDWGSLWVFWETEGVVWVDLLKGDLDGVRVFERMGRRFRHPIKTVISSCVHDWSDQLLQKLTDPALEMRVPFVLRGTKMQQDVWHKITAIPKGTVLTYQALAQAVGRPHAHRAVANACGANPVPLIVPCHRVVAKSGLGGFGLGDELKRWLLNGEGYYCDTDH